MWSQAELIAEAAEIIAAQERVAAVLARLGLTGALAAGTAAGCGRRGPGMPGSAQTFPACTPAGPPGSHPACRSIPRRGAWS